MSIHDALEEERASPPDGFTLALARIKRRNARILGERDGEPIPTAVIDRMLDEVRGRHSEDIDRHARFIP